MSVQLLDKSTIRHLHSGQVIVDVESIVKELVENSLDALATVVEIRLIDHGLHSIQVKDNGSGIDEKDRPWIAKPHSTSKIKSFQDLENIETFGFRGEALHSIRTMVKDMSLTTKTRSDSVSKKYDIDSTGNLINEQSVTVFAETGTMITIQQPFINLPVRRQLAQKNAAAIAKRVQDVLVKYALAHPSIRFLLYDAPQSAGKPSVWIKPPTSDIEGSITTIFGSQLSKMLERCIETDPQHTSLTVDALLPKKNSGKSKKKEKKKRGYIYSYRFCLDPSVILKGNDHVFFYVNQRPIHYVKSELKELVTTIRTRYREVVGLSEAVSSKKTPFIYIDIQLPPDEIDGKIESFFQQPLKSVNVSAIDKSQERPQQAGKENNRHAAAKDITNWQIEPSSQPKESNNISSLSPVNKSAMLPYKSPLKKIPIEISHSDSAKSTPSTSASTTQKATHAPADATLVSSIPKNNTASVVHTPAANTSKPSDRNKEASHATTSIASLFKQPSKATSSPIPKASSHQLPAPREPIRDNPPPSKSLLEMFGARADTPQQIPQKRALPTVEHPTTSKCNKSTLNETMEIDVDINMIRSNYAKRKEQLAKTYHIRIEDYVMMQLDGIPFTQFINYSDQFTFFIKGIRPTDDQRIHKLTQLGLLKMKDIQTHCIMNKLIREHKLICKTKLSRPVQIRLNTSDPLFSILLLLEGRERLIDDDLHGNKHITFKEVTDERVVHNGFLVRWRKEPHIDHAVIQFTSIYPLGSGYGPADFRELLSDLNKRPTKVLAHFKSLAQEMITQGYTLDQEQLEHILDQLHWQTITDSEWRLGVLDSNIVACMLLTST
ncbi:hypothetical protein G6F68_004172 [Rhizopus microsporus]|nr:hypothetical protein G6F69_003943 [Rhizopus microsporus]KAG1232622.1 hypothetical protein G6F67_004872 [Rhizopus microsporus]KAG1264667.1 hypothetical protein G6F68_004172 [Rhizopus microsporus]